ncbi:HAD superfamily hydrolase (TIGR01509 family)/beta-phosphoglucomutase family hydrolase [Pseudoduganella lurida]|uniref:HAD superfamily hydrolase (TIGR01509 family)/beta-phosphoglucomutase family hydrolase n=1 Tax=Pseudoduganella lurida TaxID=1036180 RepID=A0A562RLS1_9BURK|nr:HAD family phosphatase [Pseudoduganella lurida]TWI69390.1 HAD superfamily hydrolase (TIGR01509 family)/beta-phosphoglucomutase family hydrolase [Pseudoduganella lurida]
MTQTPRAFIFDMDGTIVDNMSFHTKSWIAFLAKRGRSVDPDDFFRDSAGRQGHEIMRSYMGADLSDAETATLDAEKESLYRDLYGPHLEAVAGFESFIETAQEEDVRLAVATAAPPANIVFTLDGLDLRRHFDAVVGAADVARGKPNPDVFLLAAERCGVAPGHCIVFEDAPLGVEAARRAGMRAVVLTTTLPASAFAEFDNVICIARDFTELDIDALFDSSPLIQQAQ